MIDYPQFLHSTSRRAENGQQEIADISSGIRSPAKELNVPIVALSQMNRELEREKNRKLRMSNLRESGAIEHDAGPIGLLYKSNAMLKKVAPRRLKKKPRPSTGLLIAKQRNRLTGDVHVTFLKSCTRFESAAKVSGEDVPDRQSE